MSARTLRCALAAALVLVQGSACERAAPPPKDPIPVRIQTLTEASAAAGRRYSATIDPKLKVELDFEVEGTVAWIEEVDAAGGRRNLQPGDAVRKGQLLARIDDRAYVDEVEEAKARVARAAAELRKAEAAWHRDTQLYRSQSITAPEYDRTRKEYESAQAEAVGAAASLDRAEFKLTECAVSSPLDGVVLSSSIERGSYVRPGSAAFEVADVSSVKVVFGVPAGERAGMAIGRSLQFSTTATGARRFLGIISSVAASADSRTRVFEIEATVPNPDQLLLPGMIAALESEATDAEVTPLVVPIRAVLRDPGDPKGYAVAVVEGEGESSVARIRTVALGDVYGADVIVTSGLDPGARLIVTGSTHVSDGLPVRVVP